MFCSGCLIKYSGGNSPVLATSIFCLRSTSWKELNVTVCSTTDSCRQGRLRATLTRGRPNLYGSRAHRFAGTAPLPEIVRAISLVLITIIYKPTETAGGGEDRERKSVDRFRTLSTRKHSVTWKKRRKSAEGRGGRRIWKGTGRIAERNVSLSRTRARRHPFSVIHGRNQNFTCGAMRPATPSNTSISS